MLETTAREIAEITGGHLVGGATGDERVTGAARIDSRSVTTGDLFAAFVGEHTDGHRFLAAAHEAGATVTLVSQDPRQAPGSEPAEVPGVLVDDVGRALSDLARAQLVRARQDRPELTVLAVTGSAGKTGTKDLLGRILGEIGPTIAPVGSFNNELGVPLTVLRLQAGTRFLVLEMGSRGLGHITHLTEIARPDLSLVLNVGSAHLGEFGSAEAIARAKGELVQALAPDGRAVLNAEDPRVAAMAELSAAPVVTWGFTTGDVRGADLTLDADARIGLTLEVPEGLARLDGSPVPAGSHAICPDLVGEHQAANVLAALTASVLAGADPAAAAACLEGATLSSGQRMEVLRRADVLIIDDAYNANPDSLRHALKTLAHLGRGRRTIAVLGEMLELGEDSARLHDEIGRLAVRLNISQLYVVGDGAAPIHHGASLEGSFGGESVFLDTVEEAIAALEATVAPGDAVLIKSSRDAGLRRIARPLLAHLEQLPPAGQGTEGGDRG